MKKLKDLNPHARPTLFLVLLISIAALILSFLLSSCSVTKKTKSLQEDKIEVAAADSGSVSKNSTTDKKGSDYWKETIVFPPAQRDCTVNHYNTYPNYPAVIYREGGSSQEEKTTENYDSSWNAKFELLLQQIKTKDTEKETKVLSAWQIIALGFGAALFGAIVSKFKITRS